MKKNKSITYKYFVNIKYIFILLILLLFFLLDKEQNTSFFLNYFFNKEPKISIFMPIYNKENYINNSIQSLQKQTLKDIEIIAVNDGSNDSSLSILNDLAKNDYRIKIVNNDKNHGLLYSRAMGILNSTGKYLMNLDPDDEINDSQCLEYLYNQTQILKVDILQFNVFFKAANWTFKCNYNSEILKQPNLYKSTFSGDNGVSDYLIWNKLIKKETFLKAYEAFKIPIYNGKWNYFEDDVWNILVSKYAQSKACADRLVYIYNSNHDSLMNNRLNKIEFQNLLYRHEMYKHLFQGKEEEKYLIFEYNFLFNRLRDGLQNILLINDYKINASIKNIFSFFINHYNCSLEQRNEINNFLKLIPISKIR